MRELIQAVQKLNESAFTGKVEGICQLGPVTYDQRKGLGNVPDAANVAYLGFACQMTPNQFLRLAEARDFNELSSIDHIAQSLRDGQPIGSPFLDVIFDLGRSKVQDDDEDDDEEDGEDSKPSPPRPATVRGHEGRTRMAAILRVYGDIPVLVAVFPAQGLRARHLSLEMIAGFRALAIPQRQTNPIKGPHFGPAVFWQGSWHEIA